MSAADNSDNTVGGRGDTTRDMTRHAELLRSLVERSAPATPAARRRALALADLRLAQTAKRTTRGEA